MIDGGEASEIHNPLPFEEYYNNEKWIYMFPMIYKVKNI